MATQKVQKMVFKTDYCLMQVKSILQYFRPSLSYHLSFRSLFCLFLSGRLRQVLLYITNCASKQCQGTKLFCPLSVDSWWYMTNCASKQCGFSQDTSKCVSLQGLHSLLLQKPYIYFFFFNFDQKLLILNKRPFQHDENNTVRYFNSKG